MAEGEKKYLGFADIQAAPDRLIEEVDVPEWGGTVKLASITQGERASLQNIVISSEGAKTGANVQALLLAKCLINGDGRRIFDDSPHELAVLEARHPVVIDRLFSIAQRLNGMQTGAVEEAKKKAEGETGTDGDVSAVTPTQ